MASLFESVLSAHYHIALLRARHSPGPASEIDFTNWKSLHDRVRRAAGGGPLLSRLHSPDHAADVLDRYVKTFRSSPGDNPQALHAHAAWGLYDEICTRFSHRRARGLREYLQSKAPRTKTGPSGGTVDENLDQIFQLFIETLAPKAKVISYKTMQARLDQDNVTRFQAQIVAETDSDTTLAQVANLADPRHWSQFYPNIFTKSYRISKGAVPPYQDLCRDRFLNPDPLEPDPSQGVDGTGSWSGLFFEKAEIDLQSVPVLSGGNVLQVTFAVTPGDPDAYDHSAHSARVAQLRDISSGKIVPENVRENAEKVSDPKVSGTVRTDYSLQEALWGSVLFFVSPSGPDVDDGIAANRQPLCSISLTKKKNAKDSTPNRITITAGKNVRFSEEASFAEEQNAFALPLWSTAIIAGLVKSLTL